MVEENSVNYEEIEKLPCFVYGTLRPDDDTNAAWRPRFLENTKQTRAVLPGAQMFNGKYPIILLTGNQDHKVIGWLVEVNDPANYIEWIKYGDTIEGYPGFYDRTKIQCEVEGSGKRDAWVYFGHKSDDRKVIPSGDWLKRNEE
mmetsp:Transcript_4299/g.4809  ORF Transcript_4299/g.4809 Transcript_4299/m.4809 type:complete len:144 (+) Transcript_4299:55-486(+)